MSWVVDSRHELESKIGLQLQDIITHVRMSRVQPDTAHKILLRRGWNPSTTSRIGLEERERERERERGRERELELELEMEMELELESEMEMEMEMEMELELEMETGKASFRRETPQGTRA